MKHLTQPLIMKLKLTFILIAITTGITYAHCDQMNGPLVKDAKKAMQQNNVNIILKWVPEQNEPEVIDAFKLAMKVKDLNADAKKLAENYLFDVVVRVHRAAEGVEFTGVKPENTPIDPKIMAADQSIAAGNLSPLDGMVKPHNLPRLQQLFNNVIEKSKFDDNDVKAGREYIEAYVQFFKFAEGENHSVDHHSSVD